MTDKKVSKQPAKLLRVPSQKEAKKFLIAMQSLMVNAVPDVSGERAYAVNAHWIGVLSAEPVDVEELEAQKFMAYQSELYNLVTELVESPSKK